MAGLYGEQGAEVEHRARELMALFDLEEWRDELVESYSHGMRQKLIIASAFVHRPQVIVVDEPHVGLDPKSIKILRDLFKEYVRRGHTILMSTHTLDAAEALCDRIAIIAGGKIAACGTMDELRAGAEQQGGLEEIFLRLTGEHAAREPRRRARCLRDACRTIRRAAAGAGPGARRRRCCRTPRCCTCSCPRCSRRGRGR